MLKPDWTDEDLDLQAKSYGGNRFRTCRGIPIEIEHMRLSMALDQLEEAQRQLTCARMLEAGVCGQEEYRKAQLTSVLRENERDDAKAQAEAAFYRESGRWPSQLAMILA
jgi:hypothetical protein